MVALALASGCIALTEGAPDGDADADGGGRDAGRRGWGLDASLRDPADASAGGAGSSSATGSSAGGATASSSGGSSGSSGSSSASGGGAWDAGASGFDAGSSGGALSCVQWQDCPPHYGDLNSAYECVNNTCECDPTGTWASQCAGLPGYFSAFDCLCIVDGTPPPSSDPDPDDGCGWEWEYYCEPDRWVDTSRYERRCETVNGQTECRDVWVQSGRWEDGGCNHTRWVWKCR